VKQKENPESSIEYQEVRRREQKINKKNEARPTRCAKGAQVVGKVEKTDKKEMKNKQI